jgi:hypothetical protein
VSWQGREGRREGGELVEGLVETTSGNRGRLGREIFTTRYAVYDVASGDLELFDPVGRPKVRDPRGEDVERAHPVCGLGWVAERPRSCLDTFQSRAGLAFLQSGAGLTFLQSGAGLAFLKSDLRGACSRFSHGWLLVLVS